MIGERAPDEPPAELVALAIAMAVQSPCRKSRRGVVLFDRRGGEVGLGFNGLPGAGVCTGDDACRKACGRRCVHAEVRAIRDAIARGWARARPGPVLDLISGLHVKVDEDGQLVAGGPPSCAECAREILDVGLEYFWLFELDGRRWRRYPAATFYTRSLAAAGLPIPLTGRKG